jgi:hypothetical protein
MTPLEIHEYKVRWMPGYSVEIHSDFREAATAWCEINLKKQDWKYSKYTDMYRDTVHFENQSDAESFAKAFTIS